MQLLSLRETSFKNTNIALPISAWLEASLPLKFIIQLPLCIPEYFMQNIAETDPFTHVVCSALEVTTERDKFARCKVGL